MVHTHVHYTFNFQLKVLLHILHVYYISLDMTIESLCAICNTIAIMLHYESFSERISVDGTITTRCWWIL